jgi:hypothetical protein
MSKEKKPCCLCGNLCTALGWPVEVCYECIIYAWDSHKMKKLVNIIYEAGRKSVIGDLSDADDADGESSKVITR